MDRRVLILSALLWGCAGTPTTRSQAPPEPEKPPDRPFSSRAEPEIGAPTAEDVAKTCHAFIGNSSVEQWREQLIAAVSQRDDARTYEVVRCVDPEFAHPLYDKLGEWLVLATPTQLDEDTDEEWVLELRQHTPITGDGERFDLVWLAVLDWKEDHYELAGVVSRAKIHACLMADEQGLATEYSNAAMVLTEQHTTSCAKTVDVSYSRTQHRVVDGKLVGESLDAPARKHYTR